MRLVLRFAITGLAGTALDFLMFNIVLMLSNDSILSRCVGYALGTLWAFLVNRSWVFKSGVGISRLVPFLLVYLVSGTLAVAIQWGFEVTQLEVIQVFTAYGIGLVVSSLVNFFGMKLLVFGRSDH